MFARRIAFLAALLSCFAFAAPLFGQSQAAHSVNPDGSFTYRIPIEVPPGIRGVQPNLALVYNSNAGNGMLGMGWQLAGLPVVARMNYGNGVNYSASDTYVSQGGRLVLVDELTREYRTEYQSGSRYFANGTCGSTQAGQPDQPCSWRVVDPDGGKWHFGDAAISSTSHIKAYAHNETLLGGGNGAARVWALSRYEDVQGNAYDVTYTPTDGTATDYYPAEIGYTLNTLTAATATRTVRFITDTRDDNAYRLEGRAKVANRFIITKIEMLSGSTVERTYTLDYDTETDRSPRLTQVTMSRDGTAASGTLVYAAEWSDPSPTFSSPADRFTNSHTGGGAKLLMGDWNGDGLQDILWWKRLNGDNRFYKSNGDGTFTQVGSPIPNSQITAPLSCDVEGNNCVNTANEMFVGDFNGDGVSDLMWWDAIVGTNRWYFGTAGTTIAFSNASNPPQKIPGAELAGRLVGCPEQCSYNSTAIYIGDWNADGISDLLFWDKNTGENRWYTFNTSGNRTYKGERIARASMQWANANLSFGDWNGDGYTDFVVFDSNNGTNRWFINNRSTALGFPVPSGNGITASHIDDMQIFIGDWNGDGVSDPMFWSPSDAANRVYLNRFDADGIAFSAYPSVLPGISAGGGMYLGDWNSDGRTDILWWNPSNGATRWFTSNGDVPATFFREDNRIPPGDIDYGSGMIVGDWKSGSASEVIWFNAGGDDRYYRLSTNTRAVVQAITNPHGGKIAVTYGLSTRVAPQAASCGGDTTTPNLRGYNNPCGLADLSTGLVVTQVDQWNGIDAGTPAESSTFSYVNPRVSGGAIHARARLGFETFTEVNTKTGVRSVSLFNQALPYQGSVAVQETYGPGSSGEVLISRTDSTYEPAGTDAPYVVRLSAIESELREGGTLTHSYTQAFTYDTHGNQTQGEKCTDGMCTTVTRTYDTGADAVADNITSRVLTEKVTEGTMDVADSANVLSYVTVEYWGNGETPGTARSVKLKQRALCSSPANCPQSGGVVPQAALKPVFSAPQLQGYDGYGNLTEYRDEKNNPVRLVWDPVHHASVTSEKRYEGQDFSGELARTHTYNGYDQALTSTEPNGSKTTYEYDGVGRKTKVTLPKRGAYPLPGTIEYRYQNIGDAGSQFMETRSYDGSHTSWERRYFDGLGFDYQTVRQGDDGDIVESKERTYENNQLVIRLYRPGLWSAGDLSVTRRFDAQGRKVSEVGPGSYNATFSYGTGCGSIPATHGPFPATHYARTVQNGGGPVRTTCDFFNGFGDLVAKQDAAGGWTIYRYDAANRLTTVFLADNVQSMTATYDSWGRKTSIDDPAAGLTVFGYEDTANRKTVTDAMNRVTIYQFDAMERLRGKYRDDVNNLVSSYAYGTGTGQGKGRLTETVEKGAEEVKTLFEYDESGNVIAQSVKIGNIGPFVERKAYDLKNRLTEIHLPDDRRIQYAYSAAGNLLEVRFDGVLLARYAGYDEQGKIGYKVTNANDEFRTVTSYTYDGTSSLLQNITVKGKDGELQDLSYEFDAFGNPTEITDNLVVNGERIESQTFTFDTLNRLKEANSPDGYGSLVNDFNAIGQFKYKYNSAATQWFNYDGMHLTGKTDGSLTLDHDDVGNVIEKTEGTTPENTSHWTYTYDAGNRMVAAAGTTPRGSESVTFRYNVDGRRVRKTHEFNSVTTVTYYVTPTYVLRQNSGNVKHKRTYHIAGPRVGRIASVTELFEEAVTAMDFSRGYYATATMFDPTTPGGLMGRIRYTALGIAHEPELGRHGTTTAVAGLVSLLLVAGFVAIRRRGMQAGGIPQPLRLGALALCLLFIATSCAPEPQKPRGARGAKSEVIPPQYNPAYELPYYGELTDLQEWCTDNDDETPCFNDQGQQPGTWFYHSNHIGSTTLVTDGKGNLAARLRYLPYGEIDAANTTVPIPVAHTFTGQEFDAETQLMNYGSRYYDPSTGQFGAADSIVDGFGSDSQGFNAYAYVGNNPVRYQDPSGNCFICDPLKATRQFRDKLIKDFRPLMHVAVNMAAAAASRWATAYCGGYKGCGAVVGAFVSGFGHALVDGKSLGESLSIGMNAATAEGREQLALLVKDLQKAAIDWAQDQVEDWAWEQVGGKDAFEARVAGMEADIKTWAQGHRGWATLAAVAYVATRSPEERMKMVYNAALKAIPGEYREGANAAYALSQGRDKFTAFMMKKIPGDARTMVHMVTQSKGDASAFQPVMQWMWDDASYVWTHRQWASVY